MYIFPTQKLEGSKSLKDLLERKSENSRNYFVIDKNADTNVGDINIFLDHSSLLLQEQKRQMI